MRRAALIGIGAMGVVGCTTDLPVSTSRQPIPDPEVRVEVTDSAITLDGRTVTEVVAGGRTLPRGAVTGEGVISPLEEALVKVAGELQGRAASSGRPFRGRIEVSVGAERPAELLQQVVLTAGRAGFDKPWLRVSDGRAGAWGIGLTLPSGRTRQALASGAAAPDPSARTAAGFANPVVHMEPDRGFVVQARDEVVDPGGHGVVVPCTPTPCATWPTAELNRLARRMKLDHPRDRAVLLDPGPGVIVQDLVRTLDATRDDGPTARGERELFPEALLAAPRGE